MTYLLQYDETGLHSYMYKFIDLLYELVSNIKFPRRVVGAKADIVHVYDVYHEHTIYKSQNSSMNATF